MRAGHRLGHGIGRFEGEREGGLTTRCGIRSVEFQPDVKTIQDWSKIYYAFRWSQNVRMYLILRPD